MAPAHAASTQPGGSKRKCSLERPAPIGGRGTICARRRRSSGTALQVPGGARGCRPSDPLTAAGSGQWTSGSNRPAHWVLAHSSWRGIAKRRRYCVQRASAFVPPSIASRDGQRPPMSGRPNPGPKARYRQVERSPPRATGRGRAGPRPDIPISIGLSSTGTRRMWLRVGTASVGGRPRLFPGRCPLGPTPQVTSSAARPARLDRPRVRRVVPLLNGTHVVAAMPAHDKPRAETPRPAWAVAGRRGARKAQEAMPPLPVGHI